MVQELKKLGTGGICRQSLVLRDYPFPVPAAHSILPPSFDVFKEIFPHEGYVYPRSFPSSSFKKRGIVSEQHKVVYGPTHIDLQVLYNSMRKLSAHAYTWDEQIALETDYLLDQNFGKFLVGSRISTYHDVLQGLDLDTSPGYPLYYKCQSKKQALEKYEWYVQRQVIEYLQNPSETPIWSGTLKDELTHESKITSSSTRMFFNGPLWFVLVCRILWLDMAQRLQASRGQHPSTIGMSVSEIPQLLMVFQDWFKERSSLGDLGPEESGPRNESAFYHFMIDGDHPSYDLTTPTVLAYNVIQLHTRYLPSSATIELGSQTITFNPQSVTRIALSHIYLGRVAIGGNLYLMWGNKSGTYMTGEFNSYTENLTMYPALRNYLGADPVKTWLECAHRSGGDDMLKGLLLTERLTHEQIIDTCSKYGCYLSTVSGVTSNCFDMMFYSHMVSLIYDREYREAFYLARPREDKLWSALAYVHRHDPALSVARFYAVCNGLFGRESRYEALDLVDNWVSKHPRHKIMDPEWKIGISQRKTDHELYDILVHR